MDKWGPVIRLIGVGFYISFCLIAGVALGLWLDRIFNTRIIFTLSLLVVGLILAFWGVYRMLLPLLNNKKERR